MRVYPKRVTKPVATHLSGMDLPPSVSGVQHASVYSPAGFLRCLANLTTAQVAFPLSKSRPNLREGAPLPIVFLHIAHAIFHTRQVVL
jgi:hypothetical protein